MGAVWSDDNVELLKKLWTSGLSCSQISGEIPGGFSRNAIIGKVHRLGLAGRDRPRSEPRPRQARVPRATPTRSQILRQAIASVPLNEVHQDRLETAESFDAAFIPQSDAAIPAERRKQITELAEGDCKWPVGDPQDRDNFFFCGGPALPGLPYCARHSRIAYNPEHISRRRMSPEEHAAAISRGKARASSKRAASS